MRADRRPGGSQKARLQISGAPRCGAIGNGGHAFEDALLDAKADNFIAALACLGTDDAPDWALAWLDMSTGEFFVRPTSPDGLAALLARLTPGELLLPAGAEAARHLVGDMVTAPVIGTIDALGSARAETLLTAEFGAAALDALRDDASPRAAIVAAAQALAYVQATQFDAALCLRAPRHERSDALMGLDAASLANLEILRTQSGELTGSLLGAIDLSVTAAGGRAMAARLASPLADRDAIEARLEAVAFLRDDTDLRARIRMALKALPDMARALTRLAMGRGGPRDCLALGQGLGGAAHLANTLAAAFETPHLKGVDHPADLAAICDVLSQDGDAMAGLADMLVTAVVAQPPLLARDGGFVADGYDAALDAARGLRDESRRVIAGLQNRYAEETGIKALKIKYNGVLGYHIDVPASHGDTLMKPPFSEIFIHRQTLANAVRFSTQELAELAGEISRAGETALALEGEIFEKLRSAILAARGALEARAEALAALDVCAALAELAGARDWCRPQLFEDTRFHIEAGRHPVVEAALRADANKPFIANHCALEGGGETQTAPRLTLLTGPNMAGKSTFLRQNALLVILAQMGSFVPAARAEIGIVDRVFSRVGAADDLARGRSTFMVEMVETATILQQASPRSLVILDEIGRGTATFDGLSIAWACVEYLHDCVGCRTLFATHYHELTALAERLEGLSNASMRVREHDGKLVFLHEVGKGAADRSYGIHVAELAGLPTQVTHRARHVLQQLEENDAAGKAGSSKGGAALDGLPLFTEQGVAAKKTDALRDTMTTLDPDRLSPREALDWLYRLKALSDTSD
jgi:DNA mismatch repair protein MutS